MKIHHDHPSLGMKEIFESPLLCRSLDVNYGPLTKVDTKPPREKMSRLAFV